MQADPATPPAERARPVPSGHMVPLGYHRMVVDIPRGTEIGGYRWGLLCRGPYSRLGWTALRRAGADYEAQIYDVLSGLGYDMVGDPALLFDEDEERQRAEYLLAGRITAIEANLCNKVNWLTGWEDGVSGAATVRIDWTVQDRIGRKPVLRRTTEGRAELEEGTVDGAGVVLGLAVADAIRTLGLSPEFRTALTRRDVPASPDHPTARTTRTLLPPDRPVPDSPAPDSRTPDLPAPDVPGPDRIPVGLETTDAVALDDDTARSQPVSAIALPPPPVPGPKRDDPGSAPPERDERPADPAPFAAPAALPWIDLDPLPAFSGPLSARAERVVESTVLIAAGAGHGSGVILDGRGLVLTNHHVVGAAERVRVVLADGVALVGTVERINRRRDVALLRLPFGRYPALPVRTRPVGISEPVFAVGAPLSERHRGTVTGGIVGGLRRLDGQAMIQADVTIQPGSSGGPLVDGSGNLVGLSAALANPVVTEGGVYSSGLNLFVPISDALAKLAVRPGTDAAENR